MKIYEFDLIKYKQICHEEWFEDLKYTWFKNGLIQDLWISTNQEGEIIKLFACVYKECFAKFDEEINRLDHKMKLKAFW